MANTFLKFTISAVLVMILITSQIPEGQAVTIELRNPPLREEVVYEAVSREKRRGGHGGGHSGGGKGSAALEGAISGAADGLVSAGINAATQG